MATKKKLAIIIVNWNGLEHLKGCLPSLAKQRFQSFTVFLVDNASTDGSIDYVRRHFPATRIIENATNEGFALGNNRGIERAMVEGFEYLFLLNNDTVLPTDVLTKLVHYMDKHPQVGVAQPKLLLLDHKARLDSCGSYLSWNGFILHEGVEALDGPAYSKVKPIFTVKGAAMITRRATLTQTGLFDPDYFAYFEETDLCWRTWLAGARDGGLS
jgi:GT2 family glycosyltransferase